MHKTAAAILGHYTSETTLASTRLRTEGFLWSKVVGYRPMYCPCRGASSASGL